MLAEVTAEITSSIKTGKLCLLCSDGHPEQVVSKEFSQSRYILTALEVVLDFAAFEGAAALDYFIHQERIAEILIVNNTDCTFIEY